MHDRGAGRWRLHLTQEQMQSMAYGVLAALTDRSTTEANRFGRDYDVEMILESGIGKEGRTAIRSATRPGRGRVGGDTEHRLMKRRRP
ncbi:DUF6417 family protein [Streptomyces sp. NPDC048251]|uniref:DUF6417 family protein n=1 Tax=Streptomyces sp. NPDC048251 TaxID=3154501 RepID=UPI003414B7C3